MYLPAVNRNYFRGSLLIIYKQAVTKILLTTCQYNHSQLNSEVYFNYEISVVTVCFKIYHKPLNLSTYNSSKKNLYIFNHSCGYDHLQK